MLLKEQEQEYWNLNKLNNLSYVNMKIFIHLEISFEYVVHEFSKLIKNIFFLAF